jgi:hypothetical protein
MGVTEGAFAPTRPAERGVSRPVRGLSGQDGGELVVIIPADPEP